MHRYLASRVWTHHQTSYRLGHWSRTRAPHGTEVYAQSLGTPDYSLGDCPISALLPDKTDGGLDNNLGHGATLVNAGRVDKG